MQTIKSTSCQVRAIGKIVPVNTYGGAIDCQVISKKPSGLPGEFIYTLKPIKEVTL